ncbi:flagellar protein FlgN [Sphingomonas sp. MMS12-HWE2-04]|uniref:flagellar protein FlgN n=1 Tax=Sphingomonas sp. MMS12-HWE2-04 TaxID=3234199 RepID=UPI00384D3CE6
MTEHLIDAMVSLASLMEEETEKLARTPYLPELGEIASAKLRLTGRIEAEVARLKRESDDWAEKLEPEAREALTEASRHLRDASAVNKEILARQIELSVDMMGAIAAEAQRLTGKRNTTYGACGGISGMEMPAPISINARL